MALGLEAYKKAAGRVQEFLSRSHKLRLPMSSALELVALVHGARNWQTLQAAANRSSTQVASASSIPVDWNYASGEAISISVGDWRRHVMVAGTPEVRQRWANLQVYAHLESKRGALVLGMDAELLEPVKDQVRWIARNTLSGVARAHRPLDKGSSLRLLARAMLTGGVWAVPCTNQARTQRAEDLLDEDLLSFALALEKSEAEEGSDFSLLLPYHGLFRQFQDLRLSAVENIEIQLRMGMAYTPGDGLRRVLERGRSFQFTGVVGCAAGGHVSPVVRANIAHIVHLSQEPPTATLDSQPELAEEVIRAAAQAAGLSVIVGPTDIRIGRGQR